METLELTLAERGQIVIPKEARDALGLKAGAKLQIRLEGGRLLIEKKVQLDLSRWAGKALDDGLTTHHALAEMRPWSPYRLRETSQDSPRKPQSASAPTRTPALKKKEWRTPR